MVFQWFFIVGPLVTMVFPMVFHKRQCFFTVGPLVSIVFSMVFPLEMMVSQWFFTVGPLVSMVFQWFLMVANHWSNDGMVTIHRYGLQYMLNIAQCTCTHLLKGRAHIKWSKNLQISWQSYRYHQYPKHIPSYLEPLLTYADNMTELCVDLRYFFLWCW